MADSWENISFGMKVEIQNLDCDLPNIVYWIATVMKLAGNDRIIVSFRFDLHMI